MNWVDLLLLLLVLTSCWRGLHRGFICGVGALVGLVGGIWLACRSYALVGAQLAAWWPALGRVLLSYPAPQRGAAAATLGLPPSLLNLTLADVAAFAAVFFLTERLVAYLGRAASGAVSAVGLGALDRLGGLLLGVVRAGIMILALAYLLTPLGPGRALPGGLPFISFLSHALAGSRLLGAAWHLLGAVGVGFPAGWSIPWQTI